MPDSLLSRPRVLVTRALGQSSALAERLRELGADPVVVPALAIIEPSSYVPLDGAISRLLASQGSSTPEPPFHWLLFTSTNAVEALSTRMRALAEAELDEAPRRPQVIPKLAAIGPATAEALVWAGLALSISDILVAAHAVAESLADALLPYARQPDGTPTRFLLLRAEEARELLPESLRAAGAEVTVAPAYRTVLPGSSVLTLSELFADPSNINAITFTSSSSVRNLLALCRAAGVSLPASALRISIGPITSRTLGDASLPPHAESSAANVQALAEATMLALHQ